MNAKKIISYVLPSKVVEGKTRLGQVYEVNYENGVKVLNSEKSNYSFGSLHQIMLKGMTEVFKKDKPQEILMLGLGAGSALSILRNKCTWNYRVTVVEIDADLIQVAEQHFHLKEYQNTQVLCEDAAIAIKKLKPASFDLIIDDIFWDNRIPDFCVQEQYLLDINRLLGMKGTYLRNTMSFSNVELQNFEKNLDTAFASFYSIKHSEYGNKIYFCKKRFKNP